MGSTTQVSNSGISYGNGNTNSGNSTITNNNAPVTNNILQQTDEGKSEILKWISPLELLDRHHGAQELRCEGVGNWLLQTSKFRDWAYGSADPTLFCYGDPGVGKTCISSLVIDTLCSQAGEPNFRVFYLYCDYLTHKERSATDLIAGLLKKAVAGLDRTPEEVSKEFEKSKEHGGDQRRPLLPSIEDMLGKILASFRRAFICIDALDEFPPQQRPELLHSLAAVIRRSPKIRLFLTGRPQIRCEMERYLGGGAQIILIRAREEDIKSYITHRLGQDLNSEEMNPKLKEDIMEVLPQTASGILLLVHLKMNTILDAVTVHDRRVRLLAMGSPRLQDEYEKTLRRIAEQGPEKSELAYKVLMWLCYSKRSLRADELSYALAVEKGSTSFNLEKVSSIQTLSSCCLGLVTVDREASTVHFIHSTLKDYLHNKPELFRGTNLMIAETCLTYLNITDIISLSPSRCIAPAEAPFLQYASCYWGEHAREEATDDVKALAKEFLRLCDKHIASKLLLLEKSWPWWCDPNSSPDRFSGLHCAAFFGLQEMAIASLDAEVSSSGQKDITGSTPLIWAARNGHEELVRLLKRKDIFDPSTRDDDGCTPFLWAARNGHEGVVALFLQEDAISLEMKDRFGRTPLSWASGGGHQGVVKLLLEQRASPGTEDNYGRTPLSWASGGGQRDVVKLLLGTGKACPNSPDKEGRAPVSWASGGGHRDVVKLLLGTGKAYPNSTDNEGRTPVSWAAEGGYEEVVDFFLHEQNVDPNLTDRDGRTLLSRAAESGCLPLVKLLLGQIGIVLDTVDNGGMTPLSWAASKGNETVIELLMKKGETGATLVNKDGSASLWWAAGSGHAGAVRLLLGGESINPNFVGEYGRTPLMRAAMHGHEQVVKLLLEPGRADCNLADSFGRTPLSLAAGSWHDKVVELLLKNGNIDTELADNDDRTPLLWAARNGDERVVQLLLKKNTKPNLRDTAGRTPVSWAAGEGHERLADLLLSQPDVDPNLADNIKRTPLSWAAGEGHEKLVGLLLSQPDVDPNLADNIKRTPLSWAAGSGRGAVIKLLLGRSDVEPDTADNAGRTPLSWAAGNGYDEAVQLLIGCPDVNSDSADTSGQTPLSWAHKNQHESVARRFEQRMPEPRLPGPNFVAQKPIPVVDSNLPTHIFGFIPRRFSVYVLSRIFQFFPYLVVLWAFCYVYT